MRLFEHAVLVIFAQHPRGIAQRNDVVGDVTEHSGSHADAAPNRREAAPTVPRVRTNSGR